MTMASAPSGSRRSREDAHRFTRPDPAVKGAAGLNLSDPAQNHRRGRHILGTHGVAVHRRHGGGRLGHAGADIFRRHAAQRVGQRHQSPAAAARKRRGCGSGLRRLESWRCPVISTLAARFVEQADSRRSPCRDRPPCTCRRRSAPRRDRRQRLHLDAGAPLRACRSP